MTTAIAIRRIKQEIATKLQSVAIHQEHIHILRDELQLLQAKLFSLETAVVCKRTRAMMELPDEPECILDFIEEVPEEFLQRLAGKEACNEG